MIKDWLAKVRPPKYLRYLFFVGYNWYRRNKYDRYYAENNIIIFISTMHGVAYAGFSMLFFNYFEKTLIFLVLGIAGTQCYFWFLYKKKWKEYVEEFKHIKRKQQKRHVVYLFLYLLVCLLPIVLPIVIGEVFGIRIEKWFR